MRDREKRVTDTERDEGERQQERNVGNRERGRTRVRETDREQETKGDRVRHGAVVHHVTSFILTVTN